MAEHGNSFEDKDLEKVTKMLERGGTMLAKHCECGAPLFKYQGRVVCPVCDSGRAGAEAGATGPAQLAVPVQTKPAVSPQPSVETVKAGKVVEIPRRQVSIVVGGERLDENALEAILVSKINDIAVRLANEEYPDKIQMYLDILETSLRVLRELRGLSR